MRRWKTPQPSACESEQLKVGDSVPLRNLPRNAANPRMETRDSCKPLQAKLQPTGPSMLTLCYAESTFRSVLQVHLAVRMKDHTCTHCSMMFTEKENTSMYQALRLKAAVCYLCHLNCNPPAVVWKQHMTKSFMQFGNGALQPAFWWFR